LGNDFYSTINNEWLNNNKIPDDETSINNFILLKKQTNEKLINLLENQNQNLNFNKLSLIYNQGLHFNNQQNINKTIEFLNKIIQQINATKNNEELFNLIMGYELKFGLNFPLNISIQSDFNNSLYNILHITSGGLGLPDRDYYFLKSKKKYRKYYKQFIYNYSKLFNININYKIIYHIEKILAFKTFTKTEKRNTEILNNPIHYNDFIIKYPNLKFILHIFNKANKKPGIINLINLEYIKLINDLIDLINLKYWKKYFIFKILMEFHDYINLEIKELYFNFYYKKILGIKKMKSNNIQSLEIVKQLLGELLGNLYITKYFKVESKKQVTYIFNYIKNVLQDYLKNNDWMENITKEKALKKLNNMNIKIGYADVICKNYNLLNILESNTYIENILNILEFNIQYILNTLYEKINKDKWSMDFYEINAYYSPNMNEIVFPAGILQAPMFSLEQDMSLNFGSIGVIIGHEITHGFDDQGSNFDEYGNLKNWWSVNDKNKYEKKIEIIKNQYDNFTIENNKVNGKLTLGENIADIGGFILSYNAYKNYLKDTTSNIDDEKLKQFFYSYANAWKTKTTTETTLNKLLIDPHSPNIFRVNGVVRNIDDYYRLFNIKPDNLLYLKKEDRAKIWI
jgi:predicted metalloendopeptidase